MSHWLRCRHDGRVLFGTTDPSASEPEVTVYEGDMFDAPAATGEHLPLDVVELLTPCEPTKMIGLWNNLAAAAAEQGRSAPPDPLFFFKPPSCFLPPGGIIRKPSSHHGRVIFEAELGVVIGKRCKDVAAAELDDCIFGYTCINDVTAPQLLREDPSFDQWSRAKSLDTFGAFGPVIATNVEPDSLRIIGRVDGEVRQDFPANDMFLSPAELVRLISRDMTLMPGDIIACGTSSGTLTIEPGATVEIAIEGIGTLVNSFS